MNIGWGKLAASNPPVCPSAQKVFAASAKKIKVSYVGKPIRKWKLT
jgi:hypothetical protein